MGTMTAKLPVVPVRNGKNYGDQKTMFACLSVVAADTVDGTPVEVVTVRWYRAHSWTGRSPTYCSIWVAGGRERGFVYSGHGEATGYGYHKRSHALPEALSSANISLSVAIDGAGDEACRDAVTAIARVLGYRNTLVIEH